MIWGMKKKRIWGIHTQAEKLFLNQNVIDMGWKNLGDLAQVRAD